MMTILPGIFLALIGAVVVAALCAIGQYNGHVTLTGLKANQNMMQLTGELTSTENKVAFARQAYNDSVMSHNTVRETFPTGVIAGLFQFAPAELFQIDNPEEKQAPKVSFT